MNGMRLFSRISTALVLSLAALFAFAANAFAATPCGGIYCEPELPEKLYKD